MPAVKSASRAARDDRRQIVLPIRARRRFAAPGAAMSVPRNDEATTAMANNPQKAKDATEEALSAIQEALNVRESDIPAAASRVEAPKVEVPRVEAARAEAPRVEVPRMDPPPAAPIAPADLFNQEPESTGWA